MSVGAALARLLAGSGWRARKVGDRAWRIERSADRSGPSGPVGEAAASPLEITETEPIVVTAPKRAALLGDLPMAVSVLRFDPEAAQAPVGGTALVAARSEGLAMTAMGPGRNRLFLRGVADSPFNGESQSTVAVVLDDARLTYAAPDPDIRLVDVERVEVLKGPQGSLYGSGTLGGIYHIVTRRAKPGDTSLSANAGAESLAHGAQGWSASAAANLPLVGDAAALRLVGYSAREAGWIDTGARRDGNETHVLVARANLGVEPGGGWRLDVSGLMQLLESHDSGYVYAPRARARPAQIAEPHDNDMRHVSFRLARERSGAAIALSSGISWHEVGDDLDATVGAQGFGLPSPRMLSDERRYRVWDSEARISGRSGDLRWLGGLSHVEARQTGVWTLSSFGTSRVIDEDRRDTSELAIFGDVTAPLFDRVKLDAGARLFRVTVVEARNAAGGAVSRRRHRNGFTPSLALSWKPHADQLVYLRYASAYRQGGSDISAGGALETLKSDELQTFEAGWRSELGKRGRLDIGVYASLWENLQSDLLQPDGLVESGNAGNARIFGAEATLDLALTPSLRLEAGANFTDAKLVRNMLGIELDDRRLPVVPRVTARLALSRTMALGNADMQLRASLRYVGPQRLSFDPAIDRPMGSYIDTRLEARTSFKGLRVSIAADNLFGGARDSFAYGNPLRFATIRQYTPQRPGSISLSLSRDF